MERPTRHGFTLIEMMAVVLIFGLLAGLLAPRVNAITGRRLRGEAEDLAAQLELARQRAIVTGVPHRVLIDVESAGYRVEWLVSEASEEAADEGELDLRGGAPIPMAAPQRPERVFQPIPSTLGRFHWLDDSIRVEGLETPEGWIELGDASIEFDADGTATPGAVHMADEAGNALVLDVLPLLETIRISDAG